MNDTDVCYLTIPVTSADQATSLATYLQRHGYSAVAELNEVTCPLLVDPAVTTADIHQLRRNWIKWWQHEDSELFSLPIFVKGSEYCDVER